MKIVVIHLLYIAEIDDAATFLDAIAQKNSEMNCSMLDPVYFVANPRMVPMTEPPSLEQLKAIFRKPPKRRI